MSPRIRRLIVVFAVAHTAAGVVLALPGPGPDSKSKGSAVTVPFELLPSNHMVLQAKLNGKGPFRLVFDVGAPVTLVSNRAGEQSGAVEKNAPKAFIFGIRGEAKLKTLQVGDLTTKDLPVIVMDHPVLKALGNLFQPLDGLIGFTFFARYKTTIDYQAKKMTFEPVDFEVKDLMKDLPERLSGPRTARSRVLAPRALWGLTVDAPKGGVDSPGVPITAVVPDSPAALAGLKPGDILMTLDGRWTTSISDVYAAAAGVEPGQRAPAVVLRDGKELALTVTPRDGI